MIKQYIKNTIYQLRNYPLLNCITILGSAFAIALIMVILIVYHAKTADYAPESNRSRSLYVKWGRTVYEQGAGHGPMSLWAANEIFGELKTPEAVTYINKRGISKLISGISDKEADATLVLTDDKFWKVHDFQLLAGNFFSETDSKSGLKKCVIVKDIARKLYGSENDAVGKPIKIDFVEYEICGVVDNVNRFCERSWAEVYAPYNSNVQESQLFTGYTQHNYEVVILAHSADDFDAIRNEVTQNLARFNTVISDGSHKNNGIQKYELMGQPDTFRAQLLRKYANQYGDLAEIDWYYVIVIIVILLIPAINLSGLTNTRMRRRLEELGIRRAFGATRGSIVLQILNENFILTLIGGIVGLCISYLSLWLMGDWLLQTTYGDNVATMNTSMISPIIFLIAILFCLVLNLLSALIPAWRITRTPIVDSLNQKS